MLDLDTVRPNTAIHPTHLYTQHSYVPSTAIYPTQLYTQHRYIPSTAIYPVFSQYDASKIFNHLFRSAVHVLRSRRNLLFFLIAVCGTSSRNFNTRTKALNRTHPIKQAGYEEHSWRNYK